MVNLSHLLLKKKEGIVVLLFGFLSYFSGYAQAVDHDIYIDYNELLGNVAKNLTAAQTKVPFGSSSRLKEQTLALSKGARAKIPLLPNPGKQIMKVEDIIKERKDGVLMIYKYYKATHREPAKVQLYATATALTEDGICLSNWHVFMGIIQTEEELPVNDSLTFVVTLKGDVYPIERILAYSKDADAAIFKINTGKDRLRSIPLGTTLQVGETVHTLTNPDQYAYYYSRGVVARNTADHKIGPMGNRMEITADYAKGSSGGPILDDRGNMAAMVSTTHSIYARDQPQVNLQMVIKTTIPVTSIRNLILPK